MKRSSISRKSPMKRKPRRKRAGEDPGYLAEVRGLPCRVGELGFGVWCGGRVQAHHAGKRPGIGLKCSDYETLPLCRNCHGDYHAATGFFRFWTKDERREWNEFHIARTQARLIWKVAAA